MDKKYFYSNKLILIAYFLLFSVCSFSQENFTSQQYANWNNIKGFTINEDENILILEMLVDGRTLLFQSNKVEGIWSRAIPIEELNSFSGNASNLGSPFLSYKGAKLYFHANYPDSKGGMDIYSSEWNGETWSGPANFGEPVNTAGNEESPSITVTNDKILFTRNNPNPITKRKKDESPCKIIYSSKKDVYGNWGIPEALIEPINLDCEDNPNIAPDGKTIYFSSIRDKGESFDLYFTKELMRDAWIIPLSIPGTINDEDDDEFDAQFINGNVVFIKSFIKKKTYNGTLFFNSVPDEMKPSVTMNIEGTIKDKSGNPIDAKIQVLNPVTSKLMGEFNSNQNTGLFSLPLLVDSKYVINIRKDGYSFATFNVDLTSNGNKIPEKHNIILFTTIKLNLSVFDGEIFRPLVSDIHVIDDDTGNPSDVSIAAIGDGIYKIELPIGKKYKILTNKKGFEPEKMDFLLKDDIIFDQFERKMAMMPLKSELKISITDKDSKENLSADINLKNLNRDENIFVPSGEINEGKTTVMIREGDSYEVNVKGPVGYSFFNTTLDFKSETEKHELNVELKSLKSQTSITLNNITFEINSADLNEASFAELNRVVSLIQDNPSLILEISAHTDDVGTDQYNQKLSERRADSVVKYLIENGVPVERLKAKGYGESLPLVENSSEENRSMNRRVEFKIIGFVNSN